MSKEQTAAASGRRLEIAFRCTADALMLNAALVGGLVAGVFIEGTSSKRSSLLGLLGHFAQWTPIFTAVALGLFYWRGFYTRGRAYRGRYKALVVASSVSAVFVMLAAVSAIAPHFVALPRPSLIVAFAMALTMLVGSRAWSTIWKMLADWERVVEPVASPSEKAPAVLVIGGAGYVGSALVPKLLEKGYKVRLFDLFMYGEEPNAESNSHERLEIIHGDFRDIEKVVKSMEGVDSVIHIGAIGGDPAGALDENFTIEVNLTATRMIAEVAKRRGIQRFIFASTCSVYGASDEILDERSALNPVSLYARSKIACEKVLSAMHTDRFAPTILRFGTVYGLSGRTRFDLVVNLLTAKAITSGKIPVTGPDQWRPFVHVDDTAASLLAVLEAPIEVVRGQVFNVGSDEQNKTLGEIGMMIQRQVPAAECVISQVDNDKRNYRVRFSKIVQRVGFKPKWTLEAGIKQVISAFEEGKVTDYMDDKYRKVQPVRNERDSKIASSQEARFRSLVDNAYHEPQLQDTQDQVTVR